MWYFEMDQSNLLIWSNPIMCLYQMLGVLGSGIGLK